MRKFNNHYLIMRHGESEANVAGLIVSDPATGCTNFGLTEKGRQQVVASISDYQRQNSPVTEGAVHPISKVISSDFLRTTETANLSTQTLVITAPQVETGLRERFFGDWEGKSDSHYPKIWSTDNDLATQAAQCIESVDEVRQRGLRVIEKLDAQFSGEVILLVSHGDMLQILLTAFVGIPAQQHRTLPHHAQADIKLLVARG
ncbi:MAG: broad specificity phosphatase PhoE [Pseudohongiellaceae bacterium]|jgi:broad specificity phosphatase PhoE